MGLNDPPNTPEPTGTSRSKFLWCLAALAVVLGVLFHESLFEGKGLVAADGAMSYPPWLEGKAGNNMLLGDQYFVFIPQHEFTYQQFKQGHFPLWNPYIDCGVPNLASSQGALLFPVNVLLLPISPFHAGVIAACLKLFIAGWGTLIYARKLGISHHGAVLAGVVFSLSGFMIVWLGHPHVNSAIWLPLLLYWTERLFDCVREHRPVSRACAGLALVFGCVMLGGHPPTMVHVTLFLGVYFLCRWWQHRAELPFRAASWWGCAMVLGLLLATPAVLPFIEYDHFSAESASSEGMQRSASHLPLNSIVFYLLPRFSGSPVDGWQEIALKLGVGKNLPNFNERTGYVGILPWLFAVYAVYAAVRRPRPLARFFAGTVVVCVLIIYGMPPFPTILTALPVLHAIDHTRLLMIVGFSVAILAGMGLDEFLRGTNRSKFWAVAGFWAVIGLFFGGYGIAVSANWHLLTADFRGFLYPQLQMVLGGLVVSAALLLPSIAKQRRLAAGLALIWVALDMLAFARGYNPQISRDCYYPSTPAISWLEQNSGQHRIMGLETALVGNLSEVFGLRDARGCDFTTVRRYEELITGTTGNFTFYAATDFLPPNFQLLGVKYLFTFRSPNPDPAQFVEVYSNDMTVFQYRPVRERALIVNNYQVEHDLAKVLSNVRSGNFDPQKLLLLEENPSPVPTQPASSQPGSATNPTAEIVDDGANRVTV